LLKTSIFLQATLAAEALLAEGITYGLTRICIQMESKTDEQNRRSMM
jgi:hypothetical protein